MTANANVSGGQVEGGPIDHFDEHMDAVASKPGSKAGPVVAEFEFMRFVDAMNLDVQEEYLNDEDRAGLQLNRRRMLRAIEDGSLVIDMDGVPTYTPQRSDNTSPITFWEPTGASLMAMDRKKTGADVGKMFSIMADFTHTEQGRFAQLKTSDLNVCMAVATLYLG